MSQKDIIKELIILQGIIVKEVKQKETEIYIYWIRKKGAYISLLW